MTAEEAQQKLKTAYQLVVDAHNLMAEVELATEENGVLWDENRDANIFEPIYNAITALETEFSQ